MSEIDLKTKQAAEDLFMYIKDIVNRRYDARAPSFELQELQRLSDAVEYLGDNIKEINTFLSALCAGHINVEPPGRNNFLAGDLKDLQAGLLHLVWQANQVAKGDYGQRVRFFGEFSDAFNQMISQLEEREKALKHKAEVSAESMKLLTEVIDNIKDWVFVVDADSCEIIFMNFSARNMLEDKQTNDFFSQGTPLFEKLVSNSYTESHYSEEFQCPKTGKIFTIETYFIEWLGKGAYAHLVSDITDFKAHEEHLEDIAFKDALTGLYNRWFCVKTLKNFIKKGARFSICFIDLDKLKYVNDTFGHATGDEYIITVSEFLKRMLRSDDYLCRIGGDEFVMLLPNCSEENATSRIHHMRKKIIASSQKYRLSISYGVLFIDKHSGFTEEEILEKADQLMYSFKKKNSEKAVH